jgi:hypothetical protein
MVSARAPSVLISQSVRTLSIESHERTPNDRSLGPLGLSWPVIASHRTEQGLLSRSRAALMRLDFRVAMGSRPSVA